MFSGIVEEYAEVVRIVKEQENLHLTLKCSFVDELKIDQSISHNGVCLTVVSLQDGTYTVTAMKETIERSNIGLLKVGDKVNVERSMMMNGRLDGHIVQGHVDQTAECMDIKDAEGSWYFTFRYAFDKEMAKRGFLTIAFDPSFTGESGGQPRYMASPDINTEDFQAAVDYLAANEMVDPDKIGIIGICGWGGMALNTAALDTRIKATVTSTMYDMSRVNANGYFDAENSSDARYAKRQALNAQRTEDYKTGIYKLGGGIADPLPADAPFFVKDYYYYYKTKRGYHPRSLNSNGGWNVTGTMSFLNQPILTYSNEIRSAVLIIHGEKAHSVYFSKDAYKNMIDGNPYTKNKELLIIPGAVHTDLYDGGGKNAIPFAKIENFFDEYLK